MVMCRTVDGYSIRMTRGLCGFGILVGVEDDVITWLIFIAFEYELWMELGRSILNVYLTCNRILLYKWGERGLTTLKALKNNVVQNCLSKTVCEIFQNVNIKILLFT